MHYMQGLNILRIQYQMKNTGEYFDLTKTFPCSRLGRRAAAATTCRALPAAKVGVLERLWCPALSHLLTRSRKSRFIFSPSLSDGVALEKPWRTPACLSLHSIAGL